MRPASRPWAASKWWDSRDFGRCHRHGGERIHQCLCFCPGHFQRRLYSQFSFTDSNGNFKLDAFDIDWKVAISFAFQNEDAHPAPPEQTVMVSGADQIIHFVLPVTTNYFRGRIVDNFGAGVSNVDVTATHSPDFAQAETHTGIDGSFALKVYPGIWALIWNSWTILARIQLAAFIGRAGCLSFNGIAYLVGSSER